MVTRTNQNDRKKTARVCIPVPVKILAGLLLLCVICAADYVIYMQANYYRIEDEAVLETENNQKSALKSTAFIFI